MNMRIAHLMLILPLVLGSHLLAQTEAFATG